MKLLAGLCAAMLIGSVGLTAQAQAPEITIVGCVREWKPAVDVTKFPDSDRPGVAGIYLLTPLASNPNGINDVPTYLLMPTGIANFSAHLDDKVEVVGVVRTTPAPGSVQGIAGITPRPEEKFTTLGMPRLTIRTFKKISDACPS